MSKDDKGDCKERVIYDLMNKIADAQDKKPNADEAENYYLGLYQRCHKTVVYGESFSDVTDDDNSGITSLLM